MSSGGDLGPYGALTVAVLTIGILVVAQPLRGSLNGISMNWVGALIVAIGGILALLGGE